MNRFDDVKLQWEGKEYRIPSHSVMGAIARIEDVLTLGELQQYALRRNAPLAKLSMAFGSVLRYAGADVSDEDVYAGMFKNAGPEIAMNAILVLLRLMLPKDAYQEAALRAAEDEAGNVPTTVAASSKKRSKQRSVKAG